MNCARLAAAATFAAYPNGADGWLFSDECNDAKAEEMESRWDDVWSRTEEMCAAYYAAKHEYALEKDREMEKGARTAAAEHTAAKGWGGADGKGSDEEDHDTQWLPAKRRMEVVRKNKNKVYELFLGDFEL